MKSVNAIFCILLFLCCGSCAENEKALLSSALSRAGANRAELERVLEYYRNDSLKLAAARYLISYMPYHYYYDAPELDSVKSVLSTAPLHGGYIPESTRKRRWQSFSYRHLIPRKDIEQVGFALLTDNIDWAFRAWNEVPWARDYSFEDFCEWVLPYRVGDEVPEHWREAYYRRYRPVMDTLCRGCDMLESANRMARYLKQETPFSPNTDFNTPHLGASLLLNHHIGNCRDNTDHAVYVFRALGFPIATDMYRYSPSVRADHLWNVLKTPDSRALQFWYMDPNDLPIGTSDGRKKGKVWRCRFAAADERYEGQYTDESVPPALRTSLWKDVTAGYFGANECRIPLTEADGRFITLGVFSIRGFEPVDVARREGNEAVARDLEPGVFYFPLEYSGERFVSAGYPFMLYDGKMRLFRPDKGHKSVCRLTRKFPIQSHIYEYMSWMTGGRILGSCDSTFRHSMDLYCIRDTPVINVNYYYPSVKRRCRYIRFCPPDGWRPEVAELAFYAHASDSLPLPVRVTDGCRPVNDDPDRAKEKAADGDWLTFYWGANPNSTVTFDLGREISVEKILFVPRNDDNFIKPGNLYELLFYDGPEGWQSLGRQTARSAVLTWEEVPEGALLWLRNLSGGTEEQVFYMDGGKQKFCYDL